MKNTSCGCITQQNVEFLSNKSRREWIAATDITYVSR